MLEHRFAQLVAACTFLLLIIGGLVNVKGASLACTEPTLFCKGQLFPAMTGGVLYEHGHRLVAMSVGMLQIVLTTLLIVRRPGMKGLAWLTLGLVIAQGTLGAITVGFKLPWFVSTGHLVLGMSYFATLLYVAWRTRPARAGDDDVAARQARITALGPARTWIAIATGVVLVQVILGGLMRHSEATLACLNLPDCTAGEWFPAALTQRIHMIHRGWGVVTALVTTLAAIQVWRHAAGWTSLRRLALAAPIVVGVQIVLGIYVILTLRAAPVAVAHFAGAVTLWGLWISAFFVTRGARTSERAVLAPLRGVHAVP